MSGNPLTYRFLDLVSFGNTDTTTGLTIDPLPLRAVSFSHMLNSTGTLSGTLNLTDPRTLNFNWERSTRPYMTACIVDWNGTPVWGGFVTTRDYQKETGTLEITCMTFHQLFQQRLQASDYAWVSANYPHPSMQYWAGNPADPTVIAAQVLWDALGTSLSIPVGTTIPLVGGSTTAAMYNIGNGVEVQVNGAAPARIIGGWTNAVASLAMNSGATSIIYAFGNDSAAAAGASLGGPSSVILPGTSITAADFTNAGSYQLNGALVTKVEAGATVLQGVTSPYALATGMFVAGPGISLPSIGSGIVTVTGLSTPTVDSGTYTYPTVTVSQAITGSHKGKFYTIGGFMKLTINAAVLKSKMPVAISYSSVVSGSAPTPPSYWVEGSYVKSQGQTVDSIIKTLSQMGYGLGFDYTWDVGYTGGLPSQPFIICGISYPRKGKSYTNAPSTCITIDSKWCSSYEWTEDGTSMAAGVIESGSQAGGIVATAKAVTIIGAYNYPMTETSASHTKINDATELAQICSGDLALNAWPTLTATITIPLSLTPGVLGPAIHFSDFKVGDDFLFLVSKTSATEPGDPRWPNGFNTSGGTIYPLRIEEWDATISDTGVPTVKLVCSTPPDLPPTYMNGPPPRYPLA